MNVDLSTEYLGLRLKNPLVVASCSLTNDLHQLHRLEASGASAVVLPSLFEEQIEIEEAELLAAREYGAEFSPEHSAWYPQLDDYFHGPDKYLEFIEEAKRSISIPVIASLNGKSPGGWTDYSKMMEEAGADALELNVYFVAADLNESGEKVERRYLELISAVKEAVSIPVAVKTGPFFSSPANMAKQMVDCGADGLVLFNRFLQPDIDLEHMETRPRVEFSHEFEALLSLRWIAILHGRVNASLAHSGGLHSAKAILKALAVGADVTMLASVLYREGADVIETFLLEMNEWMLDHGYASVDQLRGCMSQEHCPDPADFERANYMKALTKLTVPT